MVRRPHIIMTIADDQRFDLLSLLGRNACATPNLDRLAQRGTCYRRAYTMGSTHGAVCAPSRAMLHTGWSLFHIPDELRLQWQFPYSPAMNDPANVPLLGELLRQAGYRTIGIGKWHNSRPAYARSFDDGDAIFFGGMKDPYATPVYAFDPTGAFSEKSAAVREGHATEVFLDAALRIIEKHGDSDQPIFLYVAFTAPHDPRTTEKKWHDRYRPEDIELPPNFLPEHPFDNGELDIRDEHLSPWPRTEADIRQHMADYFAMTTHMDDAIGRLHEAVARSPLGADAIIVHTADHGLAVGQHGLLGKQNLYDHSVRVPLIVAGPGFDGGGMNDALVYMHDLFPTFLNLAGVEVPASCQFTDLRSPSRRSTLFSTYRDCQRMVTDGRWKLIDYHVEDQRRQQLFDTQEDPWELHNLAADPQQAQRLAQLNAALIDWRRRAGDPVPWGMD